MHPPRPLLLIGWMLIGPALPAQAQTDTTTPARADAVMALQRLDGPVRLDGVVDEAAWQRVAPLPVTMSMPTLGGTPTEHTEIRVAYDDDHLYAAGRFYAADRASIRGNSLSRDSGSESDDYFALLLDSFNDNENALAFFTTPAGIRVDWTIYGDAQFDGQTMPINESWNTFWDVATTVTDDGWFAEMRIPFSSLRFQERDARVVMGLMTWRWIAAKSELQSFPEAPPKWFMSQLKPSIMQDVSLEGVRSRTPVYVTPYALGGLQQTAALNDAETAYDRATDPTRDLGLDVKYPLTSNLTLDLSLNTDFAQVEADDEQVNLTRFSLFFPEKRQFFQERASIFDFETGGPTRLFYSRRIGLSDEGPVRLYGGARLVGRLGRWDVGFLDMQTARASFDTDDGPVTIPSENFGVLRLRRQVFNENSYAGGMVTSRLGDDGSYNLAYGLDGVFRLFGDDYLTVGLVHTVEDSLVEAGAVSPLESGLARLRWARRTNEGLGYEFAVTSSAAQYNPGMGFVLRTDVTRLGSGVSYSLTPGAQSRLFKHVLALESSAFARHEDGSVESAEIGPQYVLIFKSFTTLLVNPKAYYEDLREPFELSDDVAVPAGSYTFYGITAGLDPAPRLFRTGFVFDAGSFYDGWRLTAGLAPTWTLSRHLELSGEYLLNRVRFPDRDQRFSADILRLRARAALDTHLSANAFVQYNSFTDAVLVNLRLRYNFSEGHDLYVVYNEGLNTDRRRETPFLPLTDTRTILVKYTYTFVW